MFLFGVPLFDGVEGKPAKTPAIAGSTLTKKTHPFDKIIWSSCVAPFKSPQALANTWDSQAAGFDGLLAEQAASA